MTRISDLKMGFAEPCLNKEQHPEVLRVMKEEDQRVVRLVLMLKQ